MVTYGLKKKKKIGETFFFLLYDNILKILNYLLMSVFVRLLVLALPNMCLDEVRDNLLLTSKRIEFRVLSTPVLVIRYAFTEGVPKSLSTRDIC